MNTQIEEMPPSDLRETFSGLRVNSGKTQSAMTSSLVRHGQISPIVCLRRLHGLEVIDGFKRLRSGRTLQKPTMQVRILDTTACCGKVEMIRLNRISRSITPIEEALVVHSLHRDDGLSLEEIAVLIGHDLRWISRRCNLMEGLHEEVRHHLFAGTIRAGIAWELAQLPRDTQANCVARILKYRLGQRNIETILEHSCHAADPLEWPWRILEENRLLPASSRRAWYRRLAALNQRQRLLLAGAVEDLFPDNEHDHFLVQETIENGRKMNSFLDHQLRDDPPEVIF